MDKEQLRIDFWNENLPYSKKTNYDLLLSCIDYFMGLDVDFYKFANNLLTSDDYFRSWDANKIQKEHDAIIYFIGSVGKDLFYDCRTRIIRSKNHDYMQGQKDYYLKRVLEKAASVVHLFDVCEFFEEKFDNLTSTEIHAVIALATIMGWRCEYDVNKSWSHSLDKTDIISFKKKSMPYILDNFLAEALDNVSKNIKPQYDLNFSVEHPFLDHKHFSKFIINENGRQISPEKGIIKTKENIDEASI